MSPQTHEINDLLLHKLHWWLVGGGLQCAEKTGMGVGFLHKCGGALFNQFFVEVELNGVNKRFLVGFGANGRSKWFCGEGWRSSFVEMAWFGKGHEVVGWKQRANQHLELQCQARRGATA